MRHAQHGTYMRRKMHHQLFTPSPAYLHNNLAGWGHASVPYSPDWSPGGGASDAGPGRHKEAELEVSGTLIYDRIMVLHRGMLNHYFPMSHGHHQTYITLSESIIMLYKALETVLH